MTCFLASEHVRSAMHQVSVCKSVMPENSCDSSLRFCARIGAVVIG